MKKFLFIVFCFISLNTKAQSQKDHNNILSLLENQRLEWNKGNIEGYMQGYWKSDSLIFLGKNGITKGWTNTLKNYKHTYPNKTSMGTLQFDIKKVEFLSKNKALVIGAWKLQREKDAPQGYFSLIFKKITNQWFIVLDHSS